MKDIESSFLLDQENPEPQEGELLKPQLPFLPNLTVDLIPKSEKPKPYLLGLLVRVARYKIDYILLTDVEDYIQKSDFQPQDYSPINLPICLVSLDPSKIRSHLPSLKQTHYTKIINLLLLLLKDEFQNPENIEENKRLYPIIFSALNQGK